MTLRLDEDHERVGDDSVVLHRLGACRRLHRGHHRIHVGHVHENADARAIGGIDEGADVGHAERAEKLLPLRRCEPVVRVRHVVVAEHRWHESSSLQWISRRPPASLSADLTLAGGAAGFVQATADMPPSTYRSWPFTKSDADDERKTTAPASSDGSPQRPAGTRARSHASNSAFAVSGSVSSVRKYPGPIAFAWMLN